MPKYPGISPYDNEKGTLGTAKKRWEKLYVKEIESDTVSGINANIEYLATTAENSVSAATSAKNAAVAAQGAAEQAAETAATAAAGIQSVVETDVDNTLSIAGVAADAKVTGDWLRDIAKPVTLDTSMPATAYADEFMKVTTDSDNRVLYGVKRDGSFYWQKGVPKHLQDKINELAAPTIDNDEYMYVMLDSEGHVLFGVKRDGSFDWQKGLPKPVREKFEEVAQTVIQSEEFVQLTQDADGKIIEGVLSNGTKKFIAPVNFDGDVRFNRNSIIKIADILKDIGFNPFDYTKYSLRINTLFLDGNMTGISKEDKVNLSYRYLNEEGTCTLKWQGSASLTWPKKNYTMAKITPQIDLGWGNQKKYVLKSEYGDYSHARNNVCAKLWGKVVKSRNPANRNLLAAPNYGAVDGFPIMLVINGEYQGAYNFNIPKDPWMMGMGSGNYEAMITAEAASPTTSFKATTSREDILAAKYWEIEYIPDESSPDWAIDSFNRMLQACIDSTGTNYRSTLEDYLDIESAIDYYIFSCLVGHWDGINHNIIMSTYDGVKWIFNAYDMDLTFGRGYYGYMSVADAHSTFSAAANTNRVFHLIYRYDKEALKARYAELRNTVLSDDNILKEFSNYIMLMPKALMDEEVRLWPTTPYTMTNNLAQIVEWYRVRSNYLDEVINNL